MRCILTWVGDSKLEYEQTLTNGNLPCALGREALAADACGDLGILRADSVRGEFALE